MNFLGVGIIELMLIAAVALVVVGPSRFAEGMRAAGNILRKLRAERDQLVSMLDGTSESNTRESSAPPGAVERKNTDTEQESPGQSRRDQSDRPV